MRVFIFFVCLCFFLLKGYDYIYVGIHYSSSCCKSAQQMQRATCTRYGCSVLEDTNAYNERECLISDELEDEDLDNLFAKKYRSLARCYLSLPNLFMAGYLHGCFKTPQPFYGHSSYKYITQRVLRI